MHELTFWTFNCLFASLISPPLYYLNLLAACSACTSCTLLYLYLLQLVLVTRACRRLVGTKSVHVSSSSRSTESIWPGAKPQIVISTFMACLLRYYFFEILLVYFWLTSSSYLLSVQLTSYLLLCSIILQVGLTYLHTHYTQLLPTQLSVFSTEASEFIN